MWFRRRSNVSKHNVWDKQWHAQVFLGWSTQAEGGYAQGHRSYYNTQDEKIDQNVFTVVASSSSLSSLSVESCFRDRPFAHGASCSRHTHIHLHRHTHVYTALERSNARICTRCCNRNRWACLAQSECGTHIHIVLYLAKVIVYVPRLFFFFVPVSLSLSLWPFFSFFVFCFSFSVRCLLSFPPSHPNPILAHPHPPFLLSFCLCSYSSLPSSFSLFSILTIRRHTHSPKLRIENIEQSFFFCVSLFYFFFIFFTAVFYSSSSSILTPSLIHPHSISLIHLISSI